MDEDIKKVLLDLLLKLDEICNKHNLRYYIAFGTCLGALRHKGFIPWDHDIDVLMPAEDAKKLFDYQDELGEPYFIQSKKTDPAYGSIAYKLRNSDTACIWPEYKECKFNQGLNIDIYPYYTAPDSKLDLLFNIWRSHFFRILTIEDMPIRRTGALKYVSKIVLALYKGERRVKARDRLEEKLLSVKNGSEILDYFGLDITLFSAITYPKEWFGDPRRVEFEGCMVNAPTEPEKYLERRYGNYMELPPIEKRIEAFDKPGAIIDAHKSYKDYLKEGI